MNIKIIFLLSALCLAHSSASRAEDQCQLSERTKSNKYTQLDDDCWELLLKGEWLVGFCAPFIIPCVTFDRVWTQLAVELQRENCSVLVASMKPEYTEIVIRRYSLSKLPSILHVKNGVFRLLPVSYDLQELKQLAYWKWNATKPLPYWQDPKGLVISAYIAYIKAIEHIYYADWCTMDYERVTWLVRFAVLLFCCMLLTLICNGLGYLWCKCAAARKAKKFLPKQSSLVVEQPGEPIIWI
ncbi:thioredoxin-related transmembrane protein 4-like [Drosophila busckii]|uniref:thioredoxin-related transmembrane protein 4-like n=1 Tax=Drosophila busckii TaxID=30019 RepID=UPI00083ED859|nr:thioredoxin-related transmembrane protein 4-like [Drosophila busckii]